MTQNPAYPKVFAAGNIGNMTLPNRIVMPSIAYVYPKPDGLVPQRMKDYLEARAKGGAGLVIVEYTLVEPSQRFAGISIRIDNDAAIPSFMETAELIKKHGARAGIQLAHVGDRNKSAEVPNLLAETDDKAPRNIFPPDNPEDFTLSEIKRITESFGSAAGRAKRAGFDGIEIHAAHGSNLLARFISPAANGRTDSYGGSAKNRARFLLEIVATVREAVGKDYPLWCRINGGGTEGITASLTVDEVQEHARLLEAAGVNALSVSALPDVRSYYAPTGYYVPYAEIIKRAVRIPIIATGNITPEIGEKVISEGKADFVIMGRALLADPELPTKTRSGKEEDVTTCIKCSFCRFGRTKNLMQCSVNAAFGMERESRLLPAARPKKVMVIGGGPGGMEAARVAAMRGHDVVLYEKDNRLGGQLLLASVPPYKERIASFTRYLAGQIEKLKVRIELDQPANPLLVKEAKPEAVILATGVVPVIPEIPGIDQDSVVLAQDILSGRKTAGDRVVIIGGELVACETAHLLSEKGKRVTLTRRSPEFGVRILQSVKEPLFEMLQANHVQMFPGIKYEKVTGDGLVLTGKDNKQILIEADTIVLAAGSRPNNNLLNELREIVNEVYAVGDCVEPRNIYYAVYEGYHTARNL